MNNERVFNMIFADVYPLYIQKVERKGRNKDEVDKIICWLTGYNENDLLTQINKAINIKTFFNEAPYINSNANKIKGVVCGVKVEDITDPLMQKIRWLDKLIDELAKGKSIDKILRV